MIMLRGYSSPVRPRPTRRGFSLIEVSISTLLVSLVMIASLNALSGSKIRERSVVAGAQGEQLALDLMNEILGQAYQDPTAPGFGPEAGEVTNPPTRSLFNDVDDYLGWTGSPPTDKSGNVLAGFNKWTRSVTVEWADRTTLASSVSTNTGLKKITVTVSFNGKTAASVVSYRSTAWVDTIPTPSDASGNHPPIAACVGSHLSGTHPLNATFNATTSSDPDGDALSYVWKFGDGATAEGITTSHTYNTAGTYNCILTVYDGRGGVSTVTTGVTAN